jgi:hypothetical protein
MLSMTSYQSNRRSRAVEHGEKYQYHSHNRVQSQSTMSKGSVIANSSADSSHPGEYDRAKKHTPAGQRKQNQADNGGRMDQNEPGQH